MKRFFYGIVLCVITLCVLTGCGAKKATEKTEAVEAVETEETADAIEYGADGSIAISTSYFSDGVQLIDLTCGETKMQLLAHMGSDGQPKLSWNTCRVCNGSPYAFFEYQNGQLVCENCGNAFPVDSIGGENDGCYPWTVSEYSVDNGKVIVSADAISAMEPNFRSWRKGI